LDDLVIPTTLDTLSLNIVKKLKISKAVRYNYKSGLPRLRQDGSSQ